MRANCVCWLLLGGAVSLQAAAEPDIPTFQDGTPVGTNQSALINEASGLAASRRNPHVLWTHNDSGDSARVFAINPTGRLLGVYSLSGASAQDWEDMAIGSDPGNGVHYLYTGDIGDNDALRSSITVYRVPEPPASAQQEYVSTNLSGVEAFQFVYPDGARDAETLLVDPLTGDLFIISKREARSRIYRAVYPQVPGGPATLEYLGQLTIGGTTGGDISPSGHQILIKKPGSMHYYARSAGQTVAQALTNAPATVPCASEPQGEAVGWQGQEKGYYTLSEETFQPVYYYPSVDSDSDGLPDAQEVAWCTDMHEPDSDGDRHANGHEVVAGESPTNSASVFRIVDCGAPDGRAAPAWFGRSNRLYDVQYCMGGLTDSCDFTNAISNIFAITDGLITTNVPTTGTVFFLRLRVRHEDGW